MQYIFKSLNAISGIIKEEIVYARFLEDGQPVTKMIAIEAPDSVDSAGLTKAILKAIASLKLANEQSDEDYLASFYTKLINVNFDGASVMSGHLSGVQKRFKDCQPGCTYTHCVAHKLELAVLDGIKFNNAYLPTFDESVNNLFKFYYYSTVRRKELKQLADLLDSEFKQLGLLKKIRWVASRSRSLNILETNFPVIIFDLEAKSYGSDETAKKALGYLEFLKNPQFLFYLHFMEDLVSCIKELSLIFQKNNLLICEIPRLVEEKIESLDMLTVMSESFKRLMSQLSVSGEDIIYKDVILSKLSGRRRLNIEHLPSAYEAEFGKVFEVIIAETQRHLRKRFENFNKTPLNNIVKIFDFKSGRKPLQVLWKTKNGDSMP